jgi:hypothetical protein
VLNIVTGETIAFVRFEDAVQEIFAVQALPGMLFPDLINDSRELIAGAFVLPNEAFKEVPESPLRVEVRR